jgi:hypothetical protein
MASTITNYSININTAFPTPGVDNDTAGFRNNFSAIKNALNVASSEISVIQQKAITSVDWSIIANKPAFSTVSTSGSYYDQGSALPKFYGSLINIISYKHFTLMFQLYCNWGNKIYDQNGYLMYQP